MEQMSSIRDQQESLAKLHFEIGARQDPSAPLSEEGNDLTNCGVSSSGIQNPLYFCLKMNCLTPNMTLHSSPIQ